MPAKRVCAGAFAGFIKFTMTKIAAILFSAGLLLAACSKTETPVAKMDERVNFQTLEANRAQAAANAEFNAQGYRAENPRFTEGFKIITHTDSTIDNNCPQGDGWASVSIMRVNDKQVEKYTVKCSTVSAALGCYLESDFAKKSFASDEGKCQPQDKVPFPLPKIAK